MVRHCYISIVQVDVDGFFRLSVISINIVYKSSICAYLTVLD